MLEHFSGFFWCAQLTHLVFWYSILFQPNLANLQLVAELISTVEKTSSCGPQTPFTANHKPQSKFYEEFKGFGEVTLYNTNKRDVVWVACNYMQRPIW